MEEGNLIIDGFVVWGPLRPTMLGNTCGLRWAKPARRLGDTGGGVEPTPSFDMSLTALSFRGNTSISVADDSRAWAHHSPFVRLGQLTEGLPVHRGHGICWFNVKTCRSALAPPYLLYLVLLHFLHGTNPMTLASKNLPCQPWPRPRYPSSYWRHAHRK